MDEELKAYLQAMEDGIAAAITSATAKVHTAIRQFRDRLETQIGHNAVHIDAEELAICKRRGHDAGLFLAHGWAQCRWCGLWLREVHTIEEREDAPPPEDKRTPIGPLGLQE